MAADDVLTSIHITAAVPVALNGLQSRSVPKMPECQAKFCTVVRGKGISTFSIPVPKKNYELCAKWIHNLGNAKLNPKTFVYSNDKIVCERHFKEDCFKEDMMAKIMGYTPKRKQLKEDAVPTVFDDSKPEKIRETSLKRSEKRDKQELIRSLVKTNKDTNAKPDDQPGPSTANKTVNLSRLDIYAAITGVNMFQNDKNFSTPKWLQEPNWLFLIITLI